MSWGLRLRLVLCVIALPLTVRAELVRIPAELDLATLGIEFTPDHFSHPRYRVGYVEKADLAKLPPALESQVAVLDSFRWARGGYDRETFAVLPVRGSARAGYHDYTQLTDELKRLRNAYPGLIRIDSAGKSIKGRELWYVVISDNADEDENEPNFLYHANMHGDEVVGRELMLYFMEHLLQSYGKDSRITQLVDHSQIFIMPSMNPDGFEAGTRENSRGKDLNRNFPDRFKSPADSPVGREVEVERMMTFVQRYHFVFGMNWHGGEICFNLPWGNIKNDKPANMYWDDSFFNPIGREYTQLNKTMYANHHDSFDHGLTYGYEWYPVNGGINDWFNFYRRSVHAVVELSYTKWPNANDLVKYWDDNREAMVTYLWRGLRGVHLEIRDSKWNLVSQPTITVASSPGRPIRFDDGYVHRLTGDGPQQVTVSAPGFKTQTVSVQADYFNGQYVPVLLQN